MKRECEEPLSVPRLNQNEHSFSNRKRCNRSCYLITDRQCEIILSIPYCRIIERVVDTRSSHALALSEYRKKRDIFAVLFIFLNDYSLSGTNQPDAIGPVNYLAVPVMTGSKYQKAQIPDHMIESRSSSSQ